MSEVVDVVAWSAVLGLSVYRWYVHESCDGVCVSWQCICLNYIDVSPAIDDGGDAGVPSRSRQGYATLLPTSTP